MDVEEGRDLVRDLWLLDILLQDLMHLATVGRDA